MQSSGTGNLVIPSPHNPEIKLSVSESRGPVFYPITSPDLTLKIHEPLETLSLGRLDSVTILLIPAGLEIGGWRLKTILLAQIRHESGESVAITWLEKVAEYGAAENDGEAVADLVISLGEYRKCLEERQGNLGDSARRELESLRTLIEPATSNAG